MRRWCRPRRTGAASCDDAAVELGIYTFAELTSGLGPEERLRDLLEEIELADQVGLDVFGVGEHHRPDFAVSAPAVVLAGRRGADEADPAHERGQRAQLRRPGPRLPGLRDARPALGRPRRDHGRPRLVHRVVPALRLRPRRLRRALRREARAAARAARAERVTWRAAPRADRRPRRLPAAVQDPLPVWVAVGGTPESASAPARSGCRWRSRSSAALPERFVAASPSSTAARPPRPATTPPALSINSHGFVADDLAAGGRRAFPAVRRR